jgi:hypothetical protein
MLKTELQLIQTVILLLDGTSEVDILLKCDLAPFLRKAKEMVELMRRIA